MAASQDECVAAYSRSQVCNDRLYSRLLSWAAYVTILPMPPTDVAPDVQWVRERITAERMPAQVQNNTWLLMISPYTLEVPNVANNVRTMLNAWNTEAVETQLAGEVDAALAVVMPKFAKAVITDQEVANWCTKNGYPIPEGLDIITPAPPAPLSMIPAPMVTPIRPVAR